MEKNSSQRYITNFKIATIIFCSIIILATIVASIVIIKEGKQERKELIAKREEEMRAQIIENNMRMGEAEEGILFVDGKEVDPEKGLTKIDGREVGIGESLAGETGTETETPTTDTSNWDLSKVTVVTDEEGKVVPVPKGFVASGVEGEKLVRTGFVIYEGEEAVNGLENEEIGVYSTDANSAWQASCTRNQFVWVPVEDPSRIYEEIGTTGKKKAKLWEFTATGRTAISNGDTDTRREPGVLSSGGYDTERMFNQYAKMQGYTREKFLKELEDEYENCIESIKKYGGFYIGRYETGNIGTETPVVKRMNTDIGSQTWYAMYPRMKKISSNGNIQIGMIWGSLWDETLQWFIDTKALDGEVEGVIRETQAAIASNSTTWGNYSNATFEYTTTSGGTATKSGGTRIPTGSAERNKANNIYDMAGNVYDRTLEGDGSSYRCYRGGGFNDIGAYYPARYRINYYPIYNDNYIGFRAYFIIK